ncbi:phospholipase-like protein [Tanacetum coccineum]
MTIAEYLEYEKTLNKNHIDNTKSYLPTYFGKGAESDCDSEDMEEEVEYMTDDEEFISEQEESDHGNEVDRADDNTPNTAPCWLPMELSLGSFLLPFNIDSHNLYATTTLDAKNNMPQRVHEYLGLDKLRDTSTFENTTGTNEPLGTVNILVKFRELEFPCNFIIEMVEDAIILGRPFLKSTRAQIDVFNEEISFEIGSKKFKSNIDSYQSIEKIYMVDIGQEEETFNPLEIGIDLFSYESPACLEFEQRTRRGLVKRWHVCKPVHVTYDDGNGKDCGMWPTCDPDSTFCFGYNEVFGVNEQGSLRMWICFRDHERRTVKGSYMGFADFLQVRYGQQKIDDTTQERRIGHNNLHESDREFIFNEWILDSYDVEEEYAREIGDPYSRRFDEYNRTFNNEIEHLSNEYILRIGKKGYVLDDIWEKCQQNYKKTNEAWHDEAYEEDEM